MEKVATEDAVWRVCERLKAEGRKISGRSVLNEVGGSLSTVLRYIETWRARSAKEVPVASEIPVELQESLRRSLGFAAQEATEALRVQMEEASSREAEALEALETGEQRIAALEKGLADAKAQIVALQQSLEKEAAVAAETIAGLRENVTKFEQENNHLIRAGEAARTETAKAVLQVERADAAAAKAEARVLDLEAQIVELSGKNAEAEKGQAVAERQLTGALEQVAKLEARLTKGDEKLAALESERSELARELNQVTAAHRKAEGAGEQMTLRIQENTSRIQEGTAVIDQLRKELEYVRATGASAEKRTQQLERELEESKARATHAEQELKKAEQKVAQAENELSKLKKTSPGGKRDAD